MRDVNRKSLIDRYAYSAAMRLGDKLTSRVPGPLAQAITSRAFGALS